MTMTKPDLTKVVSWWGFEELSGTAYDLHAKNNLLEYSGTIERTNGVVKYGRNFELNHSEMLYKNYIYGGFEFADDPFTLGAWVKPESVSAGCMIMGSWGINIKKYNIGINSTGYPRFRISPDMTNTVTLTYPTSISVGHEYLILAWHDPVADKMYLQVNNGAVAELSHTTGCYPAVIGKFTIGGYEGDDDIDQGAPISCFDGMIDEPFVYAGILTADQREWFYNNGNGRSYYDLNRIGGFMAMF